MDGREYWFLTDAEFVRRVHEGDFLEHVTYVSGKRYGTLRSEVDRIAAAGHVPVLELETEGALNVKEQVPRRGDDLHHRADPGARAAAA